MTKWVSKNLLLSVCFSSVIFSSCDEHVESNENLQAQSPTLTEDILSYQINDLPLYNIETVADYLRVLSLSNQLNKPVLLQFTGVGSVNSRKFENRVWCNNEVYPLLKNKFIIAQFYVDSNVPLKNRANLQDSLHTVGEFWMNYEIIKCNDNTQPIFDIVNHKNESLVYEIANTRRHGEFYQFKAWLEMGLRNFKNEKIFEKEVEMRAINDISNFQEYNVQTEEDFGKILSLSKELNKPVLLYFTGLNVVSYNKFEKKIWPDPLVYPILKNEFLIAAVYVDDRTNFPDIHIDNPPETYGEYWLEYETEKYKMSTQPIFDILNHQNESLVTGIATVRSHGTAELYGEWLSEGLLNFRNK
jgi:hypothetical protein